MTIRTQNGKIVQASFGGSAELAQWPAVVHFAKIAGQAIGVRLLRDESTRLALELTGSVAYGGSFRSNKGCIALTSKVKEHSGLTLERRNVEVGIRGESHGRSRAIRPSTINLLALEELGPFGTPNRNCLGEPSDHV
jgi:hypothetical protein